MDKEELTHLLRLVDGSGSDTEYIAIEKLRALGDMLPKYLLEKYRGSTKAKERSACVHFSTKYARSSQFAVDLGIEALVDRSKHVRHLACLLLSWSLNSDALSSLKEMEISCSNEETVGDIKAAIDAIENKNSDYFVDRDHSGMVTLNVLE